MRRIALLAAAVLVLTGPPALQAQQRSEGSEPSAGFLFGYRPHAGERALFEQGYREHLEWHRGRNDPLRWLGWDVMAGPRLGAFVDGVFGVPFRALDERVEPAADARDAELHVQAHAEPLGRRLMVLRRALSSATPLESARPTPFVQVARYRVGPAGGPVMEEALEALRGRAEERPLHPYTVYESVVGGGPPAFVLMIWRDDLASFDRRERDPESALRRLLAELGAGEGVVRRESNELWRYRRDLTYLGPDRGES